MLVTAAALLLQGCGSGSETSQLVKRLHSGSLLSRLNAISEAEARSTPRLRDELLALLESPRQETLVRGAAALALGRLHDERMPPRVVKRLPEAILAPAKASQPQTEAFILAKALTAYGPDSLPKVAPLLQHPRREVVAWAIAHHGSYRRNGRALAVLSDFLKSPDVMYRRSAAYGLAWNFHPAGEQLALKHLSDPDGEVRYHLAWVLANYGSEKALPGARAQLAREKEPRVKSELGRAVAEITVRQAAPGAPVSAAAAR